MIKLRTAHNIYDFLDRFAFTRRITRLIAAKYELLYGRDEYGIAGRVCRDMLLMSVLTVAVSAAAIWTSPDLYGTTAAAFLVYVAVTEVSSKKLHKVKRVFYRELMNLIEQVRHHYYRTLSVSSAIWEAHESVSRSMQLHGSCLYEALTSEDAETARQSYMEICPDKYLRLFATLIFKVDEEGDHEGEGGSEFLNNLKRLKLDVAEELRYEDRKLHKFTGFSLTAALPLVAVPFIGKWGTENVDGMSAFYTGSFGVIIRALCLIISIACYSAVVTLREGEWTKRGHHEFAERLAENRRIRGIINRWLSRDIRKTDRIREMIGRTGESISVWAFTVKRFAESILFMVIVLIIAMRAEMGTGVCAAAAFFGLISGYYFPELVLELKKEIISGSRQEEIIRLQSVIGISLHTAGITVYGLLETMEEFAESFRSCIRVCLYEYVTDDQAALLKMKYADTYMPFRYICDCLLMADEVGVAKAFDEITEDMESQRENNRLELNILMEDRMYLAMLLAILPGMFILFGYLLIPFLVNAMDMFNSYTGQLEGLLKEGAY